MMKKSLLLLFVLASSFVANAQTTDTQYTNPVIPKDFPDPTVIRGEDGYYYAFGTGSQVKKYRSKDLVTWASRGNAFSDNGKPSIVAGASVWAPDINYINGQYVLYYSQSVWGGEWTCGIGVATCNYINKGYFQDKGKLFTSEEIGVQNSIDPFYFEEEDGSKYLFWGSFRGIYAIQLSDDGLSLKEGAEKVKVAGTLTEGTYIIKHDGFYYLIGSAGSCCDKENSTYHLVVSRSRTLLGTYLDKSGKKALDNNMTTILVKGDAAIAPGHCSEIVQDDAGQDWILYHGYNPEDINAGRCLYLSRLEWDSNGWPYIAGDTPAKTWDKPVIGEQTATYSQVEYIDFQGADENYKYMFDTGFMPARATKLEFQCYSYPENADGEAVNGKNWRAICSGRTSNNNGISVYLNPAGDKWAYFVGGFINDAILPHSYETDYTVSANLSTFTVNGESVSTNRSNYTTTTQRLTLFSGLNDYPYYGRIYGFKVYSSSTKLVHDYVPYVRNEDGMPVFYDTVTDTYIRPVNAEGFGVGPIVPIVMLGDANNDGSVSMSDANLVTNYFVEQPVSYIDLKAADVNEDSNITMADANAIVNIFVTN